MRQAAAIAGSTANDAVAAVWRISVHFYDLQTCMLRLHYFSDMQKIHATGACRNDKPKAPDPQESQAFVFYVIDVLLMFCFDGFGLLWMFLILPMFFQIKNV